MTTSTKPSRQLTADDFDERLCPDVELPISSSEDGAWYGYGHIDSRDFAAAVNTTGRYLGVWITGDEDCEPRDVKHKWGRTLVVPEDDACGEWRFEYVDEGTPGAFPVTVVCG